MGAWPFCVSEEETQSRIVDFLPDIKDGPFADLVEAVAHIFRLNGQTISQRLLGAGMNVRMVAVIERNDHTHIVADLWHFRLNLASQ